VVAIATPINQGALEKNPSIDQLFILDFGKFIRNPGEFFKFIGRLRAEKIRLALDFDQWLRVSPLLCFLSGASHRFGFKTLGQYRHYLCTGTTPNGKGKHEVEQFADVAALAGIERKEIEDYSGFLKREGLFNLSKSTPSPTGKKPLVHFHPGCGFYGWQRAWPLEYYVALAIKLRKELGASIRLTGMGSYEEDLIEKIQALAGFDMDNRCGQLELPELAALVDQADLVVCGNTGVMHIAAGLGKTMVVPNGPANPVKWGPAASYGFIEMKAPDLVTAVGAKKANIRVIQASLPCSPCTTLGFEYGCPARPCMESIGVDIVFRECLNLLKKASN